MGRGAGAGGREEGDQSGRSAAGRAAGRSKRSNADSSSAAPPRLDEALTDELRRRFKPEVEAASEYLGRDLVGLWGYR